MLDLTMRLAEIGVHKLRWSEQLLEELVGVWQRGREQGKRVPSQGAAAAAVEGIRTTFPGEEVAFEDYRDLIPKMPGSDPDDWPHSAAALAGNSSHLVTLDAAGGFPVDELAELGLLVTGPDSYFGELAEEYPHDVHKVVTEMVLQRQRHEPNLTVEELLARWEQGLGLTRLPAAVRAAG